MWEPPSVVLKREFARLAKTSNPADLDVDDEVIENCAKQNLVTRREVKMWSEHLAEVCEKGRLVLGKLQQQGKLRELEVGLRWLVPVLSRGE